MEQIKETSLKSSESPLCPIAADVISDGESIYFYMYDCPLCLLGEKSGGGTSYLSER